MTSDQRTDLSAEAGSITRVAGIEVGHFTDARRPTGCSVVLARGGAVAGVDVRGAAPGTRETDLLEPGNLVQQVHAVLLSGGSAFGLAAADGVVQWLEQQRIGLKVLPSVYLPLVPAAVLFDLTVGDPRIRPGAQAGFAACAAACADHPAEGNVGAGAGATVGKLFGLSRSMKGGIGTASLTMGGVTVGALVACNALGDVIDPDTACAVAGARTPDGKALFDSRRALVRGVQPTPVLAGSNTTIGVIATDALLSKVQARKLAQLGHDGLARSINPAHGMSDGDTLFALGTGCAGVMPGMTLLGALAAEVTARAVLRAVQAATSLTIGTTHWPAMRDLQPDR